MLGSMPTTLIMKAISCWQMSRGRRMPRRWVGSKITWTSCCCCCCCCCCCSYCCCSCCCCCCCSCCCCSEGIGVHEKKRKEKLRRQWNHSLRQL